MIVVTGGHGFLGWHVRALAHVRGLGDTVALGRVSDAALAAAVDGASYLRRVWHVTLPALRRTLVFVSVMLVIGSFNVFISVLLMTQGGPAGQTEVPLTYTYRETFNFLEFGYGSAVAVLMTVVVLILSIGQMMLANRAERGE